MHQTDTTIAAAERYALVFMFDAGKTLIYVGHSRRLQAPLGTGRPWIEQVASIKVQWYDTQAECRAAMARVFERTKPRYNMRIASYAAAPGADAATNAPAARTLPGHCPRCGGPKQRVIAAYCLSCFNIYQRERRAARAAKIAEEPQPEEPT